jgi:hypothetical protein
MSKYGGNIGGGAGGGGDTNTVVGSTGITNVGTNTDADLAPTYGTLANTITEGNDSRLVFLADTTRPDFDDGTTPATVYVDAATGSDTTGDGTAPLPYATFWRAYQACPASPSMTRVIRLIGAGPYNAGGMNLHDLNLITIVGDDPIVDLSRTISSVGASSAAVGLVLTDADAPMGVDAHRGRLVKFTSGVLNGKYGVTIRNAANQIEVTQDTSGAAFLIPSIGDTYDILADWVTVWDFPGGNGHVLESSAGGGFTHVKFLGAGKFFFVNDTDKLNTLRCRYELKGLIIGRGGSIFLVTCSLANVGAASGGGGMCASVIGGSVLLVRGTVIDAVNAAAADAFVSAATLGTYETHGECAFRDFSSGGVRVRAAGIVAVPARPGGVFCIWRFVDCAAGMVVNDSSEGWGWSPLDLPTLHGNIASTYTVTATGGGRVRIGAGSTVTDATGIASVSADDGATNTAQNPDGTYIEGGSPAPAGFAPVGAGGGWTVATEATAARAAVSGEFVLVDAASCVVTLPAPVADARVAVKMIFATVTDIQIRTSGGGITIDGTDYSAAGLALTERYEMVSVISDGANWHIY